MQSQIEYDHPLLTTIDGFNRTKFTGIVNDQLVAFCELDHNQPQPHITTLYRVFIDPLHQGKGYASRLVSAAIEATQAQGKTAVNPCPRDEYSRYKFL